MSERPIATQLIGGADPRLEFDAAELKVVTGPDKGAAIRLGVQSLILGSAPNCDVVLHDPTVSAQHVEISITPRGYGFRDLGSTNGIKLGPLRVERAPLTDGMKLRLGDTTLLVRSLGERTTIRLGAAGQFGGLAAHSVKMRAVAAMLEQLAPSDVTVLIEGETGTGKEIAAQALHAASLRARGPFVVFDCGAIQASLIGAELFGYERGAFSGADKGRAGLLEEAEGGTLFLDEIGELPIELQPTLLGAIDRKSSRRIGGKSEIAHDVRILAATNRNLAEQVRAKAFREDLYFRVAVARIHLPPLRERPEDLPVLIDQFAAEAGVTITPEVRALCASYDWPGNVRELRNTIARLAVQPDAIDTIKPALPGPMLFPIETILSDRKGVLRPMPEARRLTTDEFEKRYLERALSLADGRLQVAAELAGVSRRFIAMVMAKHDIHVRGR